MEGFTHSGFEKLIIVIDGRYFQLDAKQSSLFLDLTNEDLGRGLMDVMKKKIEPKERTFVIPIDYGAGVLIGNSDSQEEPPPVKWLLFTEIFIKT